jgi:hypothetical protein
VFMKPATYRVRRSIVHSVGGAGSTILVGSQGTAWPISSLREAKRWYIYARKRWLRPRVDGGGEAADEFSKQSRSRWYLGAFLSAWGCVCTAVGGWRPPQGWRGAICVGAEVRSHNGCCHRREYAPEQANLGELSAVAASTAANDCGAH